MHYTKFFNCYLLAIELNKNTNIKISIFDFSVKEHYWLLVHMTVMPEYGVQMVCICYICYHTSN